MLEIVTPAESALLVELATVKAHLRPAVTGTGQDARLNDLIRWASVAISTWCRRRDGFGRVAYRQTLPGTGSQRLMLSACPVECGDADRLVTGVTLYGSEITDYSLEDPYAGILWRKGSWPEELGRRGRFGSRPDPAAQNREAIVVEFTAGYVLPGEDDPEDVTFYRLPDDVERACLLTVVEWYRADARDGAIQSESTSETEGEGSRSVSVTYAQPAPDASLRALPGSALALLKDYRR